MGRFGMSDIQNGIISKDEKNAQDSKRGKIFQKDNLEKFTWL